MKNNLSIRRDKNGVPHIEADHREDLYWMQGYVHGYDRGLQMLIMRILGQGRVCELLDAGEDSLAVDTFFRKMNWSGHVENQLEALPDDSLRFAQHYVEGVSTAFVDKPPWELKLLGYTPEPWTIEDSIMLSRMVGYLSLSQSQAEIERLLMEMIQAGVDRKRLEELFPNLLDGLDMDLLKEVSLQERIVPPDILWQTAAPRMMASNNWVVSGRKTASGKPIMANDPHLEINRLPNIWAEVVLKVRDRFAIGATMPGFPGIIIGRNRDVAWGATYAFMDAIDSWVEKCSNGKYYREKEDQWIPFSRREEVILRKKKPPVTVVFHENDHGVLDGDPEKDGYYLATRWSAAGSGAVSLDSCLRMWDGETVQEAMDIFGKQESAWNWVFSDTQGNIGFQMSGLLPKRREGVNGLTPLPGWIEANDWQGFYDHRDLPRVYNPEKGFFATANQNLNEFGRTAPINMPMGPYRAERINELLEQKSNIEVEDIFEMQFDVYSKQAERFMPLLKPLLPDTKQGRILADWDLCYDENSQGAYLFEVFYRGLLTKVFGRNGFGEQVCSFLADETGVFIDFYDNFDRILLSETSAWFGEDTRETLFRQVAEETLDTHVKRWGETRKFMMKHLMFGGKLPAFLGFDRGPIIGIGSRATIHQGQIYRSANRDTTFFPSYRIVADLSSSDCRTNIAGGSSDRRFSKWYVSDLKNWKQGVYKTVSISEDQKKRRFK